MMRRAVGLQFELDGVAALGFSGTATAVSRRCGSVPTRRGDRQPGQQQATIPGPVTGATLLSGAAAPIR